MNLILSCVGRRGYLAKMFRNVDPSVRIIGTSSLKFTPGFHDCDENYVLPPIISDEYPEAVIQLCREKNATSLLSLYDADIDRLSRFRTEISACGTTPLLVSDPVSDRCFDKIQTAAFLGENGFSTPLTFADLESAEAALLRGSLTFPLMVKPRFGFGSAHLFRAHTLEELRVFFHYRKNMIIQQLIHGQEFGIDLLSDLNGHAISVAVKRKLAMRAGETDQAISVRNEQLESLAVNIVNILGAIGPFDMDVFITEQGPCVLEMNPRFGGGYPFSHLAGADHPGKILRMLRGEALDLEVGVKKDGLIAMKEIDFRVGEPKSKPFSLPSPTHQNGAKEPD
ncbi:Conserved hypothetical protein [gamma proteobacterium HdN1]|nr:Conserved hypothetical protein [gamma proteobacterium HdN1]